MADKAAEKPRNAKSDLNRADRDELRLVPGIGPAAEERSSKHRDERGGFKSLDRAQRRDRHWRANSAEPARALHHHRQGRERRRVDPKG